MSAKKLVGPQSLTYVGTSDTRVFTKGDSVGVDLTFVRNTPLEVDGKIAKLILGDENLSLEFEGGGAILTIVDSIDDAQEPIPGLLGDD